MKRDQESEPAPLRARQVRPWPDKIDVFVKLNTNIYSSHGASFDFMASGKECAASRIVDAHPSHRELHAQAAAELRLLQVR
jgi:hypothetical protein